MSEPTSVYLYYDVRNVLLYVGITSRGKKRQDEHADKVWFRHSDHQELEHYDSRDEAAQREKWLIRNRRPPFNVQHNPDHHKLAKAYLTLFAPLVTPANIGEHPCMDCAQDDPPCDWPDVLSSHGGYCGDADCALCHADHHGYRRGIPDGYAEGFQNGEDAGRDWGIVTYHADSMSALVTRWFVDHAGANPLVGTVITGPHDPVFSVSTTGRRIAEVGLRKLVDEHDPWACASSEGQPF